MDRCLKLYLQNTIYYERSSQGLEQFIDRIYKEEPGFETISSYDFSFEDDGLNLVNMENGIKMGPPSLEPQTDPWPGLSIKLQEGSYLFTQLPVLDDVTKLKSALMPFLRNTMSGRCYVRLYKENTLECVMQFFLSI